MSPLDLSVLVAASCNSTIFEATFEGAGRIRARKLRHQDGLSSLALNSLLGPQGEFGAERAVILSQQ